MGVQQSSPAMFGIEADSDWGPRRQAHEGGPIAVGEIHDGVIVCSPQIPKKPELSRERALLSYQDFVDIRIVPEHLLGPAIEQRRELGVGVCLAEGPEDGRCQEHITDVTELDDEEIRERHAGVQ